MHTQIRAISEWMRAAWARFGLSLCFWCLTLTTMRTFAKSWLTNDTQHIQWERASNKEGCHYSVMIQQRIISRNDNESLWWLGNNQETKSMIVFTPKASADAAHRDLQPPVCRSKLEPIWTLAFFIKNTEMMSATGRESAQQRLTSGRRQLQVVAFILVCVQGPVRNTDRVLIRHK